MTTQTAEWSSGLSSRRWSWLPWHWDRFTTWRDFSKCGELCKIRVLHVRFLYSKSVLPPINWYHLQKKNQIENGPWPSGKIGNCPDPQEKVSPRLLLSLRLEIKKKNVFFFVALVTFTSHPVNSVNKKTHKKNNCPQTLVMKTNIELLWSDIFSCCHYFISQECHEFEGCCIFCYNSGWVWEGLQMFCGLWTCTMGNGAIFKTFSFSCLVNEEQYM